MGNAKVGYNHYPWQTANPMNYELLKGFARDNRKYPTEAETVLWLYLRRGLLGPKFLFQYIIGDYIVDFLCPQSRLIIEVDGAYHAEPHQADLDELRTMRLQDMGYRMLRFTNDEVLDDIDSVLDKIQDAIEKS